MQFYIYLGKQAYVSYTFLRSKLSLTDAKALNKEKIPMLYLSYIDLTPGLENRFSHSTHSVIIEVLREHFKTWTGFFKQYPEYSLAFIVTTKRNVKKLEVKGPAISKSKKNVDYTIWLPDVDFALEEYIDFIFQGIAISLEEYNLDERSTVLMREQCKQTLNLKVS